MVLNVYSNEALGGVALSSWAAGLIIQKGASLAGASVVKR